MKDELSSAPEIEEATNVLSDFYEKMRIDWESREIPEEEMLQAFSEENLSQLNLADFVLLLRKSRTEFATHVTRQGVRDHTAMEEHTAGLGEFHNNFVEILQDGRLRSVIGGICRDGKFDKDLGAFLDYMLEHGFSGSKQDALMNRHTLMGYLAPKMKSSWSSSFEDMASVHFGLKAVLEKFYGAESGNEIFFVVPIAHFLADHHISKLKEQDTGEGKDNDMWIYSKDYKGIGINTSIVFIPKSTMVDRNTGSIYDLSSESGEDPKKIEDTERLCTAEEYWTKYFKDNPQQKPKRIIFYDGDPNQFLEQWKEQNKLKPDIPRIGRKIHEELSDRDHERYLSVIRGEIDKHYPPPKELQDVIEYVINNIDSCQAEISSFAQASNEYFELGNSIKGETVYEQLLCFVAHYDSALKYGRHNMSFGAIEIYDQSSEYFKALVNKLIPYCEMVGVAEVLEYDFPYVENK